MNWWQFAATILGSILASSGLWAVIQKRMDKNDNVKKMVIGLAHDRIIYLGMNHISKGYITQDDYENLHDYLFVPYKELGGNGSAARVMQEVDKLPIVPPAYKPPKGEKKV